MTPTYVQNVHLPTVKAAGTYGYHRALKDWEETINI
jgi:hypothetical protein